MATSGGRRRVVVTGMGVISPLGNDVGEMWERALAGESGITALTAIDPSGYPCRVAGQVHDFDPAHWMDRRTARRLKRGRIPVEARLDLHGKTQDEAHAALGRFVRESRMAGRRCVMVITGKGSVASGRGGVLRRMTPRWLDGPALRRHVVAIATAPESAGGRGALYVLLKRRAGPEPS